MSRSLKEVSSRLQEYSNLLYFRQETKKVKQIILAAIFRTTLECYEPNKVKLILHRISTNSQSSPKLNLKS